jgi:hypothetical protein
LPKFRITQSEKETEAQFLARLELEAENVVGGYGLTKHDACIKSLPNGGHPNWVFEVAGVAYGLLRHLGTEPILEA